jgi:hypothetical protein
VAQNTARAGGSAIDARTTRHEGYAAYRRKYGDQCWELDALPPEELARLTRETIEEHIDWPQWGDSTTAIEVRQASLRKLVDTWESEA